MLKDSVEQRQRNFDDQFHRLQVRLCKPCVARKRHTITHTASAMLKQAEMSFEREQVVASVGKVLGEGDDSSDDGKDGDVDKVGTMSQEEEARLKSKVARGVRRHVVNHLIHSVRSFHAPILHLLIHHVSHLVITLYTIVVSNVSCD